MKKKNKDLLASNNRSVPASLKTDKQGIWDLLESIRLKVSDLYEHKDLWFLFKFLPLTLPHKFFDDVLKT